MGSTSKRANMSAAPGRGVPRRQQTRQPTIVSTRQRIIVVDFDTPAEAAEWDELDDVTALATLMTRPTLRLARSS